MEKDRITQLFNKSESVKIFADVPPILTEESIEKYIEAGFNYYIMTEDYIKLRNKDGSFNREYFDAIKTLKDKGLKIIIRNMHDGPKYFNNLKSEFQKYADGYYMCDEPSYEPLDWEYESTYVDDLIGLADWYNENRTKDSFFHINLLQSYGVEMLHGTKYTYERYLDHYIETVLNKVVGKKTFGTDFYPLATENGRKFIKDMYLFDYFCIASRTKKLQESGQDVITSFCIQACEIEGLKCREIETERDILFQNNVALCFGAKCFEFYLYNGEKLKCSGIVTKDGYGNNYDCVSKANNLVHGYDKYILPFDWVGGKIYCGNEKSELKQTTIELTKKFFIENFRDIKEFSSTKDAVVSQFEKDGERAYFILNFTEPSLNETNKINITFNDEIKQVFVVSDSGSCFKDVNNGVVDESLGSGRAVIVIPI